MLPLHGKAEITSCLPTCHLWPKQRSKEQRRFKKKDAKTGNFAGKNEVFCK